MVSLRRSAAAALALAAFAFPAAARAEPPMWAARDGDTTVYIFGTFTAWRPQSSWKTPRLDEAMKVSTQLWLPGLEADEETTSAILTPLVEEKGYATGGQTLSSLLTEAERARLAQLLQSAGLADQAEAFDRMKPWLAANMLESAFLAGAGYDEDEAPDEVLMDMAKREVDNLRALESAETTLDAMAGLPSDAQLALLRRVLAQDPAAYEARANAWAAGNLAPVEQDVAAMRSASTFLHRTLISRKNDQWAAPVQDLLQLQGAFFVAVPAEHLVGADSLLERLKARGVTVEAR